MPSEGTWSTGAIFRRTVDPADPLAVVESELALLQRALERLARRSDIYRDLDRASYLLARLLEATGPRSVTDLAVTLGLDGTTVTRQVAAMERDGLIYRSADPDDGRISLIELSPAGGQKMRSEQQARRRRVEELVAEWPGEDQFDLGRLLAKLNDAVDLGEHNNPTHPAARRRRSPAP